VTGHSVFNGPSCVKTVGDAIPEATSTLNAAFHLCNAANGAPSPFMSSPIEICARVGSVAACTVMLGRFEWVRLGAAQCRAVENPKTGVSHMTSFLPDKVEQITVCVRARQVARPGSSRLNARLLLGCGRLSPPSKKSRNQHRPITMRRREASGANRHWYSPTQRHANKSERKKKVIKDQKSRLVCLG
jgi:hypothetical protein